VRSSVLRLPRYSLKVH